VRPLYGDPAEPYRCSQLFIAIDAAAFPDGGDLAQRVDREAQRVTTSKRAPGIARVYAPGELAFSTRQSSAGRCTLSRQTLTSLIEAGRRVGLDIEQALIGRAT
jgi:LDH2 family malate/lactate/ureidoglycolate dehydrogenase